MALARIGRTAVGVVAVAVLLAALVPSTDLLAHDPEFHPVSVDPPITLSVTLRGLDLVQAVIEDDGLLDGEAEFLLGFTTVQGGPHVDEADLHATAFAFSMREESFDTGAVTGECSTTGNLFQRRTCSVELKNPIEIYRHDQCSPAHRTSVAMTLSEADSVSVAELLNLISAAAYVTRLPGPPPVPGEVVDRYLGNIWENRTDLFKFVFSFDPNEIDGQDAPWFVFASGFPEGQVPNVMSYEIEEVNDFDEANGYVSMSRVILRMNVDISPLNPQADRACGARATRSPQPETPTPAPGTLTVSKWVIAGSDEQVFSIRAFRDDPDRQPLEPFLQVGGASLAHGQDATWELPAGRYMVLELVPEGWRLIGIACSGPASTRGETVLRGSGPGLFVEVAAGEESTCVFSNQQRGVIPFQTTIAPPETTTSTSSSTTTTSTTTSSTTTTTTPRGTITLVKTVVDGDSGQQFRFSGDVSAVLSGGQSASFDVAPGTYVVSEQVPPGWRLAALVCDDPSNDTTADLSNATVKFAIGAGETVRCEFANARIRL